MRHRIARRKLGRTTAHRQALLRNLSVALIENEKITTTLAKAKEVRRFTEKLVTLSKKETLHARRRALQQIPSKRAVAKLFDTLSPRYATRPGGYTRILKLGPRRGDNAEMALIELVAAEVAAQQEEAAPAKKKTKRKSTKKAAAAKGAGEEKKATPKATRKSTAKSGKTKSAAAPKKKTTRVSRKGD